MSFTSSSKKWLALREVTEMGFCISRTQATKIQKGLVQVLLPDHGSFHGILNFTPLILRRLLQVLEKDVTAMLVLHLQEILCALAFLFNQLAEKVTHTFQSHIVAVEIEAQRKVGVRGLQMQVNQVVDGGLHLSGIILMDLRAHGC